MSGFVALFSQAELERFVGADTVRRILDDDRNGTADANAVTDIITDASAHVLSAYYQTFDAVPDANAIPVRLKTLGKLAGKAYLAIRHPEYVRFDGLELLKKVDEYLDALVAGNRRLGETPDPAANQGGETYSGDVDMPYEYEQYFQGGKGWAIF